MNAAMLMGGMMAFLGRTREEKHQEEVQRRHNMRPSRKIWKSQFKRHLKKKHIKRIERLARRKARQVARR